MSRVNGSSIGGDGDYYPTPPVATLAMARRVWLPKRIWEPAAGRGWISRTLTDLGREVRSSDLYSYPEPMVEIETGKNFLECEPPVFTSGDTYGIVTNPPFHRGMPEAFTRRALGDERCRALALFARVQFLESRSRYDLFREHPPSRVLIFSGRINCSEESLARGDQTGGLVMYCWTYWSKKDRGPTTIEWINTTEEVAMMKRQKEENW